jgi:nitrate/TMAO reductase-like tetraheme cytochrome c subunit
MMHRKRTILAIGLALLIITVGVGLSLRADQMAYQQLRREVRQQAETTGDNLLQVLRQGMSDNNHAWVRQTVTEAVGTGQVVQARIFGLQGKVYADSGGELQGSSLSQELPGCIECHQTEPVPEMTSLNFWPDRLRIATPIENESTCNSCHNVPNAPYLGVILVDVSLASGLTEANHLLVNRIVGSVGLALVVGLVVNGLPRLDGRLWGGWPRPRLTWVFLIIIAGLGIVLLTGTSVASHIEANNAFCASCHTEPETTYYERTLAEPVDMASAHAPEGVFCIDCHSGTGVLGRVDALTLGARNVALYFSGQYETPSAENTVIHTDHCTKCHSDVLTEFSAADHYHYFTPQWDEPTACVTCHQAHPTERNPETYYTDQVTMEAACVACHNEASQ